MEVINIRMNKRNKQKYYHVLYANVTRFGMDLDMLFPPLIEMYLGYNTWSSFLLSSTYSIARVIFFRATPPPSLPFLVIWTTSSVTILTCVNLICYYWNMFADTSDIASCKQYYCLRDTSVFKTKVVGWNFRTCNIENFGIKMLIKQLSNIFKLSAKPHWQW